MTRRRLLAILLGAGAAASLPLAWRALQRVVGPPDGDLAGRISSAIERGVRFLLAKESGDGAFRTSIYGALRDGFSLTPIAAKTLAYLPEVGGAAEGARAAARWLAGRVRADGSLDDGPFGLGYPVYTYALSAMAISRALPAAEGERAREALLGLLLREQHATHLGWHEGDAGFGGFGYGRARPRPAGALDPTGERSLAGAPSNLSATLAALGALRLRRAVGDRSGGARPGEGAPAGDPVLRDALRFVRSCQGPAGGFFASPVERALAKAGHDAQGRPQPYGSATADGLRALLACGVPLESAEAQGALGWLRTHADAAHHPGDFTQGRAPLRDAYLYYWRWSLAHALVRAVEPGPWGRPLARVLLAEQGPDGAWRNAFTDGHEDEPVIATCLALGALANVRGAVEG